MHNAQTGFFALACGLILLSGCTQSNTAPDSGTKTIEIKNSAFSPNPIYVKTGESVKFINNDSVTHTVSFPIFGTDETLNPGQTTTVNFPNVGEFEFSCTIHPAMKGKITVGKTQEGPSAVGQALGTSIKKIESAPDAVALLPEPVRVATIGAKASPGYSPPASTGIRPTKKLWSVKNLDASWSGTFTQPKVADIDEDGKNEIISALMSADPTESCATVINQGIYAWTGAGILKSGFPVYLNRLDFPGLCGYLSIVGVGNVIGGSKQEIVAATGRTTYGGGIYVISATGQILTEIEVDGGFSGIDHLHAVLSDLDNDGKMEIIATEDVFSGEQTIMDIWHGDGTRFPGWPVTLPGKANKEPAIAVLNGEKTIVISVSVTVSRNHFLPKVMAFNTDGTLRWSTDGRYDDFPVSSLVIADIDGTEPNKKEILVKTLNAYNYLEELLILSENGTILSRWLSGGWSYDYSAVAGDLDKDGQMEIIYHSNHKVYVTDYQGNLKPGFPRFIWDGSPQNPYSDCSGGNQDPRTPPYCYLTQLGVGDLSGDGFPDIYGLALNNFRTGSAGDHQYAIFAFDRFGNTLPGFPYPLVNETEIPLSWTWGEKYVPTFADIDNDGIADVVTSKGWGKIEAFTVGKRYKPELAIFPQYGVDEQNTKEIVKPLEYGTIPP